MLLIRVLLQVAQSNPLLHPILAIGVFGCCLVAQSCPTLCNSMDCSLPGSSVFGIFQARTLECVAISFSRGSPQARDRTCISQVSCIGNGFFTTELPGKPHLVYLRLHKPRTVYSFPFVRKVQDFSVEKQYQDLLFQIIDSLDVQKILSVKSTKNMIMKNQLIS